jgi:hypothetical protein
MLCPIDDVVITSLRCYLYLLLPPAEFLRKIDLEIRLFDILIGEGLSAFAAVIDRDRVSLDTGYRTHERSLPVDRLACLYLRQAAW